MVKIVIDCDETLLDMTAALRAFYMKTIDTKDPPPENKYSNLWPVWDGDINRWKDFVAKFIETEEYLTTPPVSGAQQAVQVLKRMGAQMTVVIPVADANIQARRKLCLETVFGRDAFQEIIPLSVGLATKKDFYRNLKAPVLIDDMLPNAKIAVEAGMLPIVIRHLTNAETLDKLFWEPPVDPEKPDAPPRSAPLPVQKVKDEFKTVRERGYIAPGWLEAVKFIQSLLAKMKPAE